MERIEEIEAAVERLPTEDYERFAKWFHEHEQKRWDQQLDRDSAAGRLDFLFEEADCDAASATLREWPQLRSHFSVLER